MRSSFVSVANNHTVTALNYSEKDKEGEKNEKEKKG